MPSAPERSRTVFPAGSLGEYNLPRELTVVLARGDGEIVWDTERRAVPPADLHVPELPYAAAMAALARLRERGMLALDSDSGAIVYARGLPLRKTPHTLELGGRRLYANCAVDAVGIPTALGADAAVSSRCGACPAPITLALAAGAVTRAPEGLLVWAPDFDASQPLDRHT